VLLFGMGGQLVEVFKDRSLGLPPLTTTLARRMMEQTKIYKALKGVRGRKSVNLAELEMLMVHFSQLVLEQPLIKEIDINPLLASPERLLALDARVVVYAENETAKIARPAIAPYPTQYISSFKSKKGQTLTVRPIRPEDEPGLVGFHEKLSEDTVYRRYAEAMQLSARVAHERLQRICFIDYAREMTLVAEAGGQIAGVVRLDRQIGASAELSMVFSDEWQGQGVGTELVRRIIPIGKELGLRRITVEMLPDNKVAAHVFEKVGFRMEPNLAGTKVRAELWL
jgi:acetyltransferase